MPLRALLTALSLALGAGACVVSSSDGTGDGGAGASGFGGSGTGGSGTGGSGSGGAGAAASGGTGATAGTGGSGTGGSGGGATGEPAELAGTVAAHNAVRAAHGVAPLAWDPSLAAIAQAWAERCVDVEAPSGLIDHNEGRSDGYPDYVGENIYGSSGGTTGPDAVALWASEEADYDYASNTCAANAACGHYTQVVWAATTRVGCARHECAGLQYGSVVVCNYAPGGNFNGERPY